MGSRKKRALVQTPLEVEITGLTHDGRGIGRLNNKIIFVFGALPGELVNVKHTRNHSRYDEGSTIEVIRAAKERITPICPHFGVCGGCQLQHLAPAEQIAHKQKILQEQLTQLKVMPTTWLDPLTDNTTSYRQKARLGVRYVEKKQILMVGFREQAGNKIALIENCEVLDHRVGHQLVALRELITHLQGRDDIAQIEVAIGGDEVALIFRHLKPLSAPDLSALQKFCDTQKFALYLQAGGPESVHKAWPLNSSALLSYQLADQQLTYFFHPLDFTQVNPSINQKMINQTLALLDPQPQDTILDLFCGIGNFSLPMAQRAQHVVGVEGNPQAIVRANENATHNQITNVEFLVSDLSTDFTQAGWANRQYDKIILDPPRCGAPEIVNQISRFKAKEILYVSCNSATFARDAAILVQRFGYQLEKVGVMDMFPHTAHVETMGLFKLSP